MSALIVIETFVKEGNYGAAESEARRLAAILPRHPQSQLALFRIGRVRGDLDVGAALDRALALINEETDFPTRVLLAEALNSVQRHDDVVDLLDQKTSTGHDSPALQMLIGAAINADRRVLARKLLDNVPAAVARQAAPSPTLKLSSVEPTHRSLAK